MKRGNNIRRELMEIVSTHYKPPDHHAEAKIACAELLERLLETSPNEGISCWPRRCWRLGYLNELSELKVALMRENWCDAVAALMDLIHYRPVTFEPIRSSTIRLLRQYVNGG